MLTMYNYWHEGSGTVRDLRLKRLFLLDMDGTIYLDEQLFDGVTDVRRYVRESGGRCLCLTNNSSRGV